MARPHRFGHPDLRLLRPAKGERRATYFELFFDLVYVFVITQLSHHLLANLTWSGAAETAFLLVAVYWAWNYTTWMVNWFDPEVPAVRLVLVFVMLASLLMAVAVPEGLGDHARCCSPPATARSCRSHATASSSPSLPRAGSIATSSRS